VGKHAFVYVQRYCDPFYWPYKPMACFYMAL
jgi:hypothetical protein